MKFLGSYKKQSGYLLEVPLILSLTLIVLAALLPALSKPATKVLSLLTSPIIISCLYYMIVTPGWQPGQRIFLSKPLRLVIFFIVSGIIVLLTGAYLLS